MIYTEYSTKFREIALSNQKSEEYISKCLQYAKKLFEKKLPVIYDCNHFSLLVGVDSSTLLNIANSQKHYYRKFYISKKNGKKRKIEEPLPTLKDIQKFILENILYKIPCSIYSKAFIPKKTIIENAKFHKRQNELLKIDLKNYFSSIHDSMIYNFFIDLGYSKELCILFTKLCTLSNSLPQGAPTSPYLSNLVTINLDNQLFEFCNNANPRLRYSRYADDISISGQSLPSDIIKSVSKIIKNNKLSINYDKVHIIKCHQKQIVTGIVVNQKLQADKIYRKSIRLEMYYINKFGIESHLNKISIPTEPSEYCEKLLGKISFCLQVNKNDEKMQNYKNELLKIINKKNLIYKKSDFFLFIINFYIHILNNHSL